MSFKKASFCGRGAQPKKIVLKNFAVPKKSRSGIDAVWPTLKAAIAAIKDKTATPDSLEILYRLVSDACVSKAEPQLYQRLKDELAQYAVAEQPKIAGHVSSSSADFLRVIDGSWQSHCTTTRLIRGIFLELDRSYALANKDVLPLWELSIQQYKDNVFAQNNALLERLLTATLELIYEERKGESVDQGILHRIMAMMETLDYYSQDFEPRLVSETENFYTEESRTKLHELQIMQYLKYAQSRIEEEQHRCHTYLESATEKPLLQVTRQCLIRHHLTILAETGLVTLADADNIDDLKLLHSLVSSVNELESLKASFVKYIKQRGEAIVVPPEKDKTMVDELLHLKRRLDDILSKSFHGQQLFKLGLQDAFETFINKRHNKPAELMAKFIDQKLRKGNKEMSEEEMDQLINRVLAIFRFINGKDVFGAFYRSCLAKRLLYNKSASSDAERNVIFKLKQECGAMFTKRYEDMIKDVNMSEELSQSFKQHLKSRQIEPAIDLSVAVLTQSVWPVPAATNAVLPKEMTDIQEMFKEYYVSKHNNRRLQWLNSQGDCLVQGHYPKGIKDLQVSTYQAIILLLFNQKKIMSCKEIQAATQIEMEELKLNLQSLACGKARVLAKNPKGKDVSEDDRFAMNEKFTNQHKRVKINQIQMKETEEENEATHEKVFQDRIYAVDAAIVRIMKMRKKLRHNLLINELFQQLKFPAKPSDLKKRIGSLIEREYLARDESDPQTYVYLA